MGRISYREAVGCLMYLMIVSRRDIAFAVGQISRYCKNPGPAYWEMVILILSYLSRTRNHGLFFSGSSQLLNVYSDANFASDLTPINNRICFFSIMGGGVVEVVWWSTRQSCTKLSKTEAKYVAANEPSREAVWLKHLLQNVELAKEDAIVIHCDNQWVPYIWSSMQEKKHIQIRNHYIRDQLESNQIDLTYVRTKMKFADIFTKPLATNLFQSFRDQLGIIPVPI
jgi:hypothetical protein